MSLVYARFRSAEDAETTKAWLGEIFEFLGPIDVPQGVDRPWVLLIQLDQRLSVGMDPVREAREIVLRAAWLADGVVVSPSEGDPLEDLRVPRRTVGEASESLFWDYVQDRMHTTARPLRNPRVFDADGVELYEATVVARRGWDAFLLRARYAPGDVPLGIVVSTDRQVSRPLPLDTIAKLGRWENVSEVESEPILAALMS